jgi:nucleoside-diphosphate-sugar epimerase
LQALSGHPNFEFLSGDCRNIKSVVRAVEGVDTVIHLAAIVGDPACEQDRQTALETNYAATRMLIEVAKGARVSRLIFASTCSVYGASDQLMDETSATEPISLYAQTKVQSERALLEAASESFHPIIVRLATVFGHSYRPRFDLVVNLLTARALQEGLITIYNGQQWRPFIHVRDVANGIVMLLNTPVSIVGGQVFNLGDSSLNYTLEQIAENIRQIFPGTKVAHVDNDDRRNYRVSFDKIQRLVGFQASVSLADGIHELRTAFERRHLQDYKLAVYSNQCFLQRTGGVHLPNEVDTYVMAAFSRHFTALAEAERRPA